MVVVLGISGGIASGKSTFAKKLHDSLVSRTAHAEIINADMVGHEAYAVGTVCRDKLVERFGATIETEPGGEINRRNLGAIVFSADDPERVALNDLNAIVWPSIRDMIVSRIRKCESSGIDFVVLEAAVMVQAGWTDIVDELLFVTADPDVVVQRLMSRNSLSRKRH